MAGRVQGNILSVVEAAYAIDRPEHAWAVGVLEAVHAVVRGDLGGFTCSFALERGSFKLNTDSVTVFGIPDQVMNAIVSGLSSAPPAWIETSVAPLRRPTCILTSEADPDRQLTYRDDRALAAMADGVNLVAVNLDDRGFLVSLAVPARYRLTGKLRARLTKAATHVVAAQRLRASLGAKFGPRAANGDGSRDQDATLTPGGRLVHAEGDATLASARRSLESAVRAIEQARATAARDADSALHSWKGLVAARWSLVDRFERDGTRYVVARENRPSVPGIAGLTPSESTAVAYVARGFTIKETAYALGISDATVRVLMMRAARRCGVRTRGELLERWHHAALSEPSGAPAK